MNRRTFIQLAGAGAGATVIGGPASPARGALQPPRPQGSPDVIVVGAGVFGAWTAYHLHQKGVRVTLLDAYGAGNSRASSGGETRLTQVVSPWRAVYTRMAIRAFPQWVALQERTGEPLVLETGRLAMYRDAAEIETVRERRRALEAFGITDTEIFDPAEIRSRWPQINSDDIAFAMFNPGGPAGSTLMARRSCQSLVREFERAGGRFRVTQAAPVVSTTGEIEGIRLADGETLRADQYVFSCGPWLPKIFPGLLERRLQVQRRDVIFYGVPPGDPRFSHPNLPEWSVQGTGWYGFPDIDNRGLKAAPYPDLNPLDPDTDERLVMPQQVKRAHDFLRHRFPALDGQPVIETRVCQVTNSADGNFVVDRHPEMAEVWIVGGGSGHGFKHGPALGEYVAQRLLGEASDAELDETFRLEADEPF